MRFALSAPALHVQSGYGIQARHLAHHLKDAGHHVAVLAFQGHSGTIMNIEGITHYPAGKAQFNVDVAEPWCHHFGADVLVTISDLGNQDPAVWGRLRAAGVQVLHWVPVDTSEGGALPALSVNDHAMLTLGGGQPIAMSRSGERIMRAAGHDPVYVPHGIDTTVYRPMEMTRPKHLDGKFIVACNAMYKDIYRKGFFELYGAYAAFHAKHPNSHLLIHSLTGYGPDYDHDDLCRYWGLDGTSVSFTDEDAILAGLVGPDVLAAWYNLADVYVCASWGEGFGIPVIEAQACGVPVIGTDASATTELVAPGAGWLVESEPKWNPVHRRVWRAPSIAGLARAIVQAERMWRGPSTESWRRRKAAARQFAAGYDVDRVWDEYWVPVVKRCEAGDFRHPVDTQGDDDRVTA